MNENIPLIGILGWKTGDNSYGCTVPYIQHFNSFGAVRIITPEEPIDDRFDLIVVPGGADVSPTRYNAIPNLWTSKPDPIKEYFDLAVIPKYIEIGVPIFGICRGLQAIAVMFGAKLIQHMYHETNTDITGRDALVHELELLDTSFRDEFIRLESKPLKVNSMHHQCVSTYNFPDELEILATHKETKIYFSSPEVIRHRTLPIFAVQYHPEELANDRLSDYIIELLISQSPNYVVEEVEEELVEQN